jgi:transcription antitermination factor NusG
MCIKKRVPVITTAGVVRIVGSSQGPIPIADQEIEAIQKLTHLAKKVQPHAYVLALPLGSKVRIEKGPLAGIEGVLLEHKNGAELLISVALIQQSFSVEIDGCAVALIDKPPIALAA